MIVNIYSPKTIIVVFFVVFLASCLVYQAFFLSERNELCAERAMREIWNSQEDFRKENVNGHYASTVSKLGILRGDLSVMNWHSAPNCKCGYRFEMVRSSPMEMQSGATCTTWSATAWPLRYTRGGRNTFYIDESGKVWAGDIEGMPGFPVTVTPRLLSELSDDLGSQILKREKEALYIIERIRDRRMMEVLFLNYHALSTRMKAKALSIIDGVAQDDVPAIRIGVRALMDSPERSQDEQMECLIAAINALSSGGNPNSTPVIQAFVFDFKKLLAATSENPEEIVLGPAETDVAVRLLNAKYRNVRLAGIDLATRYASEDPEPVIRAIVPLLGNEDEVVSKAATDFLQDNLLSALPYILGELDNKEYRTRMGILNLLKKVREPSAIIPLVAYLNTENEKDEKILEEIAAIFANIDTKESGEQFADALDRGQIPLTKRTIFNLCQMDTPEALDYMKKLGQRIDLPKEQAQMIQGCVFRKTPYGKRDPKDFKRLYDRPISEP